MKVLFEGLVYDVLSKDSEYSLLKGEGCTLVVLNDSYNTVEDALTLVTNVLDDRDFYANLLTGDVYGLDFKHRHTYSMKDVNECFEGGYWKICELTKHTHKGSVGEVTGTPEEKKHTHYHKDVSSLNTIDVYKVCELFEVDDKSGCLHHAIKKLLCSGTRGVKGKKQDIQEAVDTLNRYLIL